MIISIIENNAKFYYDILLNQFGTEISNTLLNYLQSRKEDFNSIKGKLSIADAVNGNWSKSIKFYSDFPKLIDKILDYLLDFHLYNKPNYEDEVILPTDIYRRNLFIENFWQAHICENKDTSFVYSLIKRK